jgi:adenylate cyclase class 2
MERSRREVEVKLPFDSPSEARRKLAALGAELIHERRFEENVLFDRDGGALAAEGKLLRVRRDGPRALLTYKAPVTGRHRHKVRLEEETELADPDAMERILRGLSFRPVYRYQKYRTLFELQGVHACLDETPIGCYVELEGAPEEIDRLAARLGFGEEQYVVDSYLALHARWSEERGEKRGDMVFRSARETGR